MVLGDGIEPRHEDFQSSALPTELPEHQLTKRFIIHIFPLVQQKIKFLIFFYQLLHIRPCHKAFANSFARSGCVFLKARYRR